jgi:branched-chain amino acid transport system ATP-binding protein/branched-chain amino acid transport system permease protein
MDYWWDILNLIAIFSVFAISLNLLLGYTGQVSVAHAAFGAIGGYLAAYLSIHAGVGFLPGLLIGAAGAGLVGVVVSLPALRLSSEYLILLTIAVSSIVLSIVGAVTALGGNLGLVSSSSADLAPLSSTALLYPHNWVIPLVVITALTYLICRRFGESAWGRILRGIRDDDVATRALGHNVAAYKTAVFGITAAFAGLAGVELFYYNQLASPDVYGFSVSLEIFAMVIFGGLGNFTGSIIGAAVLVLLQPLLEKVVNIDPNKSFLIQLVIYGLGLVVLMMLRPQGLLPEGTTLVSVLSRRRTPGPGGEAAGAEPSSPAPAAAAGARAARPRRTYGNGAGAGEVLLEVEGLDKRFGGIHACRDLSLELRRGEITALVGPNGAGKTTVFNLLTGTLRADSGSVRLRGNEIRGLRPDQIARRGMARSFQDLRLFARMSALDNVMLGVRDDASDWWRWPGGARGGQNLSDLFVFPRVAARIERETRDRAMSWLELVGLKDVARTPVSELAFGQQKLVSLARLMATDADVLLMDEPASGIDTRWVDSILGLVAHAREAGKTVCVVEHSLHVIDQLADIVFFMELGHVTAQGTIAELTRDPRLAEVYFGTV